MVLAGLLLVACAQARRADRPGSRFDLDGDGRAELLALQSWDRAIVAIDPSGAIVRTVWTLAPGESAIRVADMNGDGRGELVVARSDERHVTTVAIHRGAPEGGVEAEPWASFGGIRREGVDRAGDLDGDGLADLIASGPMSTILLGGRDTPRLGDAPALDHDTLHGLDVDGDGLGDLVANDEGDFARVYLGGSAGPVVVPIRPEHHVAQFEGGTPDPDHPERDLVPIYSGWPSSLVVELHRWDGARLAPSGIIVWGVPYDRGQIVGDGALEVLAMQHGTSPCRLGIGDALGVRAELELDGPSCGLLRAFVVGDIDGDGFEELGSSASQPDGAVGLRVTFGGREALREGFVVVPPEVEGSTALEAQVWPAGDLDGDGRAELARVVGPDCLEVRWGASRPAEPPMLPVCGTALGLVTEDVITAIGAHDTVAGDEIVIGARLFRVDRAAVTGLADAPAEPLTRVGDVNDDGFVDLALGGALVLGGANVASGAFARLSMPGLVQATRLGDVNGDGIDDLGVGADVHFGGPDVARSSPAISGVGFVGVGDHDRDGRAELGELTVEGAGIFSHAVLRILRWDAGGLTEVDRWVTRSGLIERLGDVDGDGREDLADLSELWIDGVAVDADEPTRAGDLDGDGLADVVLAHRIAPLVAFGARLFSVDGAAPVQRRLTRADLAITPVW